MSNAMPVQPAEIAARARRALALIQSVGTDNVRAALADSHLVARKSAVGGRVPEDTDLIRRAIIVGQTALDALDRETPDVMTSEQLQGLESIVVTVGRPALLIRSDRFDPPPTTWRALEGYRNAIQAQFASVGRIEVTGHPSFDWIGTGFVVAPGVVATNRHVVQEFATRQSSGIWTFNPGVSVRIDFAEEIDSVLARETPVTAIVGVHSVLDVALLAIDRQAAPPLTLDGGGVPLAPGRRSYVVGYPAVDSRRNDPAVMQSIFGNIYDVKRLQPGFLNDWSGMRQAYVHDCSTLGGNSGSCLVDLETGTVVGIHFGGRYLEGNWAVSTRDLAATGYLQRLGTRFA